MHVAGRLGLVLCVALTVQTAHSQEDEPNNKNEEDNCLKYSLKFQFQYTDDHAVTAVYVSDCENHTFPYGTSLKLWCSSHDVEASRVVMTRKGKPLPTKIENGNSVITWSTGRLNLQKNTEYTCTVKEVICKSGSLFISVTPALEVTSSDGRISGFIATNYTIEYGNSMSVICSGPNVSGLTLTKDGKQLPTEYVNSSTINWVERKPDLQISRYVCTDADTSYNRSKIIKVVPLIFGVRVFSHFYWYGSKLIYKYELKYGDTSEVYCSGPRAVKFISVENDTKAIFTEKLNETTATLSNISLELGESSFACVDSDFPDYMSTLQVTVLPRMVLMSPNFDTGTCTKALCVAKLGDPLEIICSGSDAAQLTLTYDYDFTRKREVDLQRVNATTVKWFINKLEQPKYSNIQFVCSTGKVKSYAQVKVVPHPEAVNFHCISHHLEYLNCTWTLPEASDSKINFTLSYVDNGITVRIYDEATRTISSYLSRIKFCVWYGTNYPRYPNDVATLTFIMQSCNELGCFNKTFLIDHLSVLKLHPPNFVNSYRVNSLNAEVAWYMTSIRVASDYLDYFNGDIYYRIEYQHPGMEPLEANSSSVSCQSEDYFCIIKLTLPCLERSYEVRVYQKLKRAVGEEFWSDPSSVTIYIGADKNSIVDPECYKPKKTASVWMYSVQVLREEVYRAKPQMKEEASSLHKKLKEIQSYL